MVGCFPRRRTATNCSRCRGVRVLSALDFEFVRGHRSCLPPKTTRSLFRLKDTVLHLFPLVSFCVPTKKKKRTFRFEDTEWIPLPTHIRGEHAIYKRICCLLGLFVGTTPSRRGRLDGPRVCRDGLATIFICRQICRRKHGKRHYNTKSLINTAAVRWSENQRV